MKYVLLISIVFFFLFNSCKKDKYDTDRFGKLEGKITNKYGQPIEGAIISIESSIEKSNFSGKFVFKNLQIGEYEVMVSKETYLSKIQNINVLENETANLDFTLESGENDLNISQSAFNVSSSAGNEYIDISSNAAWVIENKSNWIICSLEKGEGNALLRVSWLKNDNVESRIDSFLIKSGSITKSVVINQDFPLRLIDYKGIIGNYEKDIQDSVLLLFNKPVNSVSIKSNWELCISQINYDMVENNYGVRFSYSCADLGGEYPFTISVSSDNGQELNESINVPFYDRMIELEGKITDYILTNDEKNCWVLTQNPNKLIYLSTDSMSILKSIDLDFIPRKIVINSYNDLLYILGGDFYNYVRDNNIYIINQQSFTIAKTITIEPDEDDYSQYPKIYPLDINFTSNGYGVVILISGSTTGSTWKVIESNKNDSMYIHQDIASTDYWNGIELNFNKTKLFFTIMYGNCDIDMIDQGTQEIVNLRPGSITRGVFIKAHRLSEKIYFGQLYDQFIMDLDGNMSQISYLDNRDDGSADFSYKTGDENRIFFLDNNYLRLMDYDMAETLMSCDVLYGLRKVTSSIDGKYIYANNEDYYVSKLFKFSTDDFYRHINVNQKSVLSNNGESDWIKQ